MPDFDAENYKALIEALKRVDTSVPERGTEGSHTKQREAWVICRLLSTLATAGKLSYPLCIRHCDKPDIVLTCAGKETGIEIVEAVPEAAAWHDVIAKQEQEKFGDDIMALETPDFAFDGSKPTKQHHLQYLRERRKDEGHLHASGWAGDEPERKWATFMKNVINKKLGKLEKMEFKKYPQNWLAIYDNLTLPAINPQESIGHLLPQIREIWSRKPSFDAVFIEHQASIFCVHKDGAECMKLDCLWPVRRQEGTGKE